MSGGITSMGEYVTPLSYELVAISKYKDLKDCVILIDDAISLNGQNDYPSLSTIIKFADDFNLKVGQTEINMLIVANQLDLELISKKIGKTSILN